ncbi:MAG: methylenetetrahydrofolate--tRNA-(uracil(54)-C(5))-methyltransferase (FADH(2)-oxidizing) TrmFO [Nitrospinaceae bacterium]|nr:methylenetetrahydrofolate--tRNA-(uracil(54)-C(5))-methyltransferase (FADH(2)-oxidizing) TrmFO [Nitrospinaceae bacterium]NIR55680.1 methylenetetrahydrofolate--tRNA-(uracil(54)-C(5))-methyltransferase (FADH(2)-oxidizing) TrmFO [Nitrospinaceae bacterium]NIS86124.1 methylenetetrahydrofolate--tRNA-(uracil(54)-C(5))-methyltransferase (FADH(2)-oxidizing) TrmFO [Nitrospinaceae bacterium]NIT82968.1 methylenetetrahydrofolate--tRNA-(uracil(54)-C(5))-methyltransferase (FADH(2)-oxidizing) TrmFO [Nitrospin
MKTHLTVIGAGLAGSEAAWQAAEAGVPVTLYEMRPEKATPAHKSGHCAELVCSNSLGSNQDPSASFLLKEELRNLDSLVIRAADRHSVPAGQALAVDRELFAAEITEALENHPQITLKRQEVMEIPTEGPVIIATGPLTSPAFSEQLTQRVGRQSLYFYDALSPIIDAQTIDYEQTFFASRYGKGQADYLNCGMSRAQYEAFVEQLLKGEKVPLKEFEKPVYFEGCMPIEELASRGLQTLAFGPLKPVGLNHPETGERFHAVVQLRRENKDGTAYNMVGFQTKLTYPEQRRIFRTIPGLASAEFFRLGAIHRNTYLKAPELLSRDLSLKTHPHLWFAGQMIGVEGYVESCATGLMAALSALSRLQGADFAGPPIETALGALLEYVTGKDGDYQPMNINFGLFPGLEPRIRDKKKRNQKILQRALDKQKIWLKALEGVKQYRRPKPA